MNKETSEQVNKETSKQVNKCTSEQGNEYIIGISQYGLIGQQIKFISEIVIINVDTN